MLEEYTEGRSIPDIIRLGWETSGFADKITWEDLNEKGYYVVPTDPDWENIPAGLIEFYEDPEKTPAQTPTGKLEFYSTGLAEHFPDDPERPPVPQWIPEGESHQETIGTERSKKYPLLVMSNHPRWGVHSQHDDVTWFREIDTCKIRGADGYQYHPLWMHPADAAARGIKHGDVVSIYNERGVVLAGAYVTERIIPGAVGMDHGAKYDPIVPGEIDRGGVINTIVPRNCTSKNTVGMVVSGFLVEVEKTDLEALRRSTPTRSRGSVTSRRSVSRRNDGILIAQDRRKHAGRPLQVRSDRSERSPTASRTCGKRRRATSRPPCGSIPTSCRARSISTSAGCTLSDRPATTGRTRTTPPRSWPSWVAIPRIPMICAARWSTGWTARSR